MSNKITLTDIQRQALRTARKAANIAAEDLSVEMKYSKAWLGQLERGKFQTIKNDDLMYLLLRYTECSKYDVVSTGIWSNFLENGIIEAKKQSPVRRIDALIEKLEQALNEAKELREVLLEESKF